MESKVRGVRGAISVNKNEAETILKETKTLLLKIVEENNIEKEDIVSIFFTMTQDLNAGFPALAARKMGWKYVPMLCAVEVDVPDSLPSCIRVLMHVTTNLDQDNIKHVYLKEAKKLRNDL